nr:class A beta-lactamase-related serine hydrolase [Candidatus Omnitrophota bacterium]
MNNHNNTHNKNIDKKSSFIKILLIACLLLGFLAGIFIKDYCYRVNDIKNKPHTTRVNGYKFISPLLDYEVSPELKNAELSTLKNKLETLIKDSINKNKTLYVAVYFRDMLNGPWFGINEKDTFAPASLIKVPLMIAYLKYAEQNPDILNYNLVYEKGIESYIKQNIKPDEELELGKSYSIENLIQRMIEYSDNNAYFLLMNHINRDLIDKVYNDLGVSVPLIGNKEDFITVKEYSSFFRILFNASYLNREMSEKALDILSKSSFKIGLVAGVPANVTVAHKFAERGNLVNQTLQLHDCGIVYHKERPYLLCIMTYGINFEDLIKIIEDISSIVYKKIDNYYIN